MDAKTFITEPCLIAADIDKTFLNQGCSDEKQEFIRKIAPELLKIASTGINIAVVTGNSFKELSTRFLKYLFQYLDNSNEIRLLSKFHFFCNSGGVYFHFNEDDLQIDKGTYNQEFFNDQNSDQIKSKFINKEYLNKTQINSADVEKIKELLKLEWNSYVADLKENIKIYQEEYYIFKEPESKCDSFKYPIEFAFEDSDNIDIRFLNIEEDIKCTVQITMKPVLSWKHAIQPAKKFNNDKRTDLIKRIHNSLDQLGLSNYSACAGGNTSIDITKSKLDKSYAIRFLIDHLGIEGNERKGEKFGSNVIYLGDEVISGGGNDFPLTKINGVLVLAVNKIPKYVPFKSRVIVPNKLTGPKASALVLSKLNNIIDLELEKWPSMIIGNDFPKKNAIQLFKEEWFLEKINEKIQGAFVNKNLSPEALQILYTFITLINRSDESARKWTNILVNELDEIMEALDENEYERFSGIGSSYPKEN